jgi:hypothetical protein
MPESRHTPGSTGILMNEVWAINRIPVNALEWAGPPPRRHPVATPRGDATTGG